jgi:hypothetical protein
MQADKLDVSNFDAQFTNQLAVDSPVDTVLPQSMNDLFAGFTYVPKGLDLTLTASLASTPRRGFSAVSAAVAAAAAGGGDGGLAPIASDDSSLSFFLQVPTASASNYSTAVSSMSREGSAAFTSPKNASADDETATEVSSLDAVSLGVPAESCASPQASHCHGATPVCTPASVASRKGLMSPASGRLSAASLGPAAAPHPPLDMTAMSAALERVAAAASQDADLAPPFPDLVPL